MRLTKSLLEQIVKEELLNSQGLTTDFQEDDIVKDINPDCPHFKSQGIVIKVTPKDVTYQVTNNGKTYKDGDELTKTKDQLVKLNTNEIDEDFSVGNRKDRVSQTKKTAEVLGNKMVGEVEEPTWDLTKNKDRGDQLGESKIPLNEIRKKFFIHKISDSRLKNILLKAISKLSGGKVLKMGDDYIHLDIESKYMDVLGDFIKKYDKKRNVVIIDQFKDVVYSGKKGINKLREGIDVRKWMKAVEKGEDVVVYDKKGKRYNLQGGNNKEVQVTDHWEDAGRRNIHPEKTWQTLPLSKVKKIVSEGKLNEEKYVVASVYGDLYTPKAVPEKQALKLMMKLAKQYAGDNVFMLGVKAWNKPHKYNKKRIKVQEGKLNETWKKITKKNVKYKDKWGTWNWEIESGIDTWVMGGNTPKIILHYQLVGEDGFPSSGGNTFWLKHKNGKPFTPQEAKALVNKISNKKIHDFQRKSTNPSGSGQNIYYVDGKFLREGVLLEKKELDPLSIRKVAQMTDRNNHTEARIFLSAKMGWKKGIKFYKAMMDINDVFNGYPGGASQLNNMMEKELYREMLRTWKNYDDIYNSL